MMPKRLPLPAARLLRAWPRRRAPTTSPSPAARWCASSWSRSARMARWSGFGHGSRLRGRAQPDRHQRPCRRPGAGGQERRDRRGPVGRAPRPPAPGSSPSIRRATSLCWRSSEGSFAPIPLFVGPLEDGIAGRGSGLSRQCRPRHRPLGAGLYHAAAARPARSASSPTSARSTASSPCCTPPTSPAAIRAGPCSTSAAGCSASTP